MVTVTHLPPTVELSASTETIVVGQSAVLTWSSDFSQSCAIEPDIGVVDLNGSVAVSPTQTTTYKIIATGDGGEASDEVTITVTDPAPTVELTTTAATIILGEMATLSWDSTFASSCTIEPGIGTVAPSGSVEISPSATTTYTITAVGTGGTTTDQVTIAVEDPIPSVTFSASPSNVLLGQTSTLSWTSIYADTVEIDHGIGTVDVNGSHDVFPTQTTTYILSATGAGGSSTAEVTVTVTYPAPTVNLTISANTITLGETATLSWTSTNAVSIVIDNGIGPVGANDSLVVSPTATATYKITATGVDGTKATSSVTLTVNTPVPEVIFTADPDTIVEGEASTLTWDATHADTVTIEPGIGTVASSGSTSVSPAAKTTYTITVSDPIGYTTQIFGIAIPVYRLVIVCSAVALFGTLRYFFSRSIIGRVVVAALEDPEGARCLGLDVNHYFSIVFVLGSSLAVLGGVLYAPVATAEPYMGFQILLLAFAVVIVGGMGNLTGTFFSAILLGLVIAVTGRYYASAAEAMVFLVMAVVLVKDSLFKGFRAVFY